MDQMVWLGDTWRSSLFFPAHSIQEARSERYVGNNSAMLETSWCLLMTFRSLMILHPPHRARKKTNNNHNKNNTARKTTSRTINPVSGVYAWCGCMWCVWYLSIFQLVTVLWVYVSLLMTLFRLLQFSSGGSFGKTTSSLCVPWP